jgi:glycosyltransferase involved in cell wall biosynthesis
MLAPGGMRVQIERSMNALAQVGVQVDNLQWWNSQQTGDILHHVGPIPAHLIQLARANGWKVANTVLFTETCNRSRWSLLLRKMFIRPTLSIPLPRGLGTGLQWRTYHLTDQMIVGLHAERDLLLDVYGVASQKVSVVPLGLSETFLKAGPPLRTEEHLICTGRIIESKNSVELARLALAVKVPIFFVGKPAIPSSRYWSEFRALIDGKYVKYREEVAGESAVADLLRHARGYVLMSQYENWCLAAHEAAACGLPVLLPNQRWSRERFGDQAIFWPRRSNKTTAANALRSFWEQCPNLPPPKIQFFTWTEVAEQLRDVYSRILR